jgi:hypothetical protein
VDDEPGVSQVRLVVTAPDYDRALAVTMPATRRGTRGPRAGGFIIVAPEYNHSTSGGAQERPRLPVRGVGQQSG